MVDASQASANLLLACSVYVVGTASPGPSNLAIIATAMNAGRKTALVLALGIVSGSVFWGLLAGLGLSAVLAASSTALVAMKLLGGSYLLWLSVWAARSAMTAKPVSRLADNPADARFSRTYVRGAAMHLTNPKAILVWLSIVSLALPPGSHANDAMLTVLACAVLGTMVFCGYAFAFSTPVARRVYQSIRPWFEGALAALFAIAGVRMLLSGTEPGSLVPAAGRSAR